jgi:hypothetical protein
LVRTVQQNRFYTRLQENRYWLEGLLLVIITATFIVNAKTQGAKLAFLTASLIVLALFYFLQAFLSEPVSSRIGEAAFKVSSVACSLSVTGILLILYAHPGGKSMLLIAVVLLTGAGFALLLQPPTTEQNIIPYFIRIVFFSTISLLLYFERLKIFILRS